MVYTTKSLCALSFLVALEHGNGFAMIRNHHYLNDGQRTASRRGSAAATRMNALNAPLSPSSYFFTKREGTTEDLNQIETPSDDVVLPVEAWTARSGIGSYFAPAPRVLFDLTTPRARKEKELVVIRKFAPKEDIPPSELYAYSDTNDQVTMDRDLYLDEDDEEEMRQLILQKIEASSVTYEDLSSRIRWGKEISTLIGARNATLSW